MSLVYRDFIKYYRLIESGDDRDTLKGKIAKERENMASYGEYIRWLEKQDKGQALDHFKKMLEGYEEIAEIPALGQPLKTEEEAEEEFLILDSYLSEGIKELSTRLGVTISTIVEGAWGVVLQKYNNSNDVVFGFEILKNKAGEWTIVLSGHLNIRTSGDILNILTSELKKNAFTSLKFDLKRIIDIDDYGLLVLFEIKNEVCRPNTDFQILNPPEEVQEQIKQIVLDDFNNNGLKPSASNLNLFIQTGESSIEKIKSIVNEIKEKLIKENFIVEVEIKNQDAINSGASLLIYSEDENSIIGIDGLFDTKIQNFDVDLNKFIKKNVKLNHNKNKMKELMSDLETLNN